MINVDALNAAVADLIAEGNLAAIKVEELTNDMQSVLLAAIAANKQQIVATVAGIQAEIDKVVPPVQPTPPAPEVPQG
jgi:hypothetical protein